MSQIAWVDASWATVAAALFIPAGLSLVWRGLLGGRDGQRALLRRRTGMLQRMEGFRLTVFGLALIGAGTAAITAAKWLLLLSLGIGFVEILESSTLIAVWMWDQNRHECIGSHNSRTNGDARRWHEWPSSCVSISQTGETPDRPLSALA
jgi:hypothetical protein